MDSAGFPSVGLTEPEAEHVMRVGFIASVIFHLIVIAWTVVSFVSVERLVTREAIPVELLPTDASTRDKAPEHLASETAQAEPTKSETKVASPSAPFSPPLPPAPLAKPHGSPSGGAGGEPRGAPAPSSPDRIAQGLDPADVAALLDLSGPGSGAFASVGMASSGRATTLTQGELDALSGQARRCWDIPPGRTDPRQVSVTLRFRLNKDGTLDGTPVVVEFPASTLGKVSADNAVRALLRCAPYRLPADKFDEWNDVQLRLAPGP
jgi:hypothetical protein